MVLLAGRIVPCLRSAALNERPLELGADFHVLLGTSKIRLGFNLGFRLGSKREALGHLRAHKLKESGRNGETGHNNADRNLSIGPESHARYIVRDILRIQDFPSVVRSNN